MKQHTDVSKKIGQMYTRLRGIMNGCDRAEALFRYEKRDVKYWHEDRGYPLPVSHRLELPPALEAKLVFCHDILFAMSQADTEKGYNIPALDLIYGRYGRLYAKAVAMLWDKRLRHCLTGEEREAFLQFCHDLGRR